VTIRSAMLPARIERTVSNMLNVWLNVTAYL